jgi:hypothetical protein
MGSLVLVAIAAWQREIKLSLGDEHELRVGLRKILSFFSIVRSDCIIRPSSATSNALVPKARWLCATTVWR